MRSRYHICCGRFAGALFGIVLCGAVTLHANSKPGFYATFNKGVAFLNQNKSDSAISYFVKAFAEGLSRDSLFYFWSEAMLQNGVLDSALAANFMVSVTHTGRFKMNVLLQRHTIYSRLGWSRDAARLRDTIIALPEYRRSLLSPDFDIGLTAGYGREERLADTARPWGLGGGSPLKSFENSFFGLCDVRSTLRFGLGKLRGATGIAGSIMRRTYDLNSTVRAGDSTDVTGSLFASAAGKSFASTYNLSLNRRWDDSLFLGNSLESGVSGSGAWLPTLWAGISAQVNTRGAYANSHTWLFASARQPLAKQVKLDYLFFVNVSHENPSEFGFALDTMHVLSAADARRPYPLFYTNTTNSVIIDTSFLRVITGALRNDIIASGHDTLITVGLKLPYSSVLINPKTSLTIQWALPVTVGLSWRFNYFWEPYEWDQILLNAHYLVYSRADGAWYVMPADPMM
ncbi:MAG: hypothetical protein PHC61_07770, partial [Chitinivibrionales bacterium]|nr:hypothetical protein [Chitinivibrionales bacterium]